MTGTAQSMRDAFEASEKSHSREVLTWSHGGYRDATYARFEVWKSAWTAALSAPCPPSAPSGDAVAHYGIIDPDYARAFTIIRLLAWSEGYAIAMHGSFTRDLDLIAVPWTQRPCEPGHLVNRIVAATGLTNIDGNPGDKPHGRKVWTLLFPAFGDPRFIDLSILPALVSPNRGEAG